MKIHEIYIYLKIKDTFIVLHRKGIAGWCQHMSTRHPRLCHSELQRRHPWHSTCARSRRDAWVKFDSLFLKQHVPIAGGEQNIKKKMKYLHSIYIYNINEKKTHKKNENKNEKKEMNNNNNNNNSNNNSNNNNNNNKNKSWQETVLWSKGLL